MHLFKVSMFVCKFNTSKKLTSHTHFSIFETKSSIVIDRMFQIMKPTATSKTVYKEMSAFYTCVRILTEKTTFIQNEDSFTAVCICTHDTHNVNKKRTNRYYCRFFVALILVVTFDLDLKREKTRRNLMNFCLNFQTLWIEHCQSCGD